MSENQLEFLKLNQKAITPSKAHAGDAGFDLCCLDNFKLDPGERALIATGIAIKLPRGHAGLIIPRSGLALKHGISVVNSPGLIDEGYRGEIKVILINTDNTSGISFLSGERIAQLAVIAVAQVHLVEVKEISDSSRGQGGFGSSGRR